MSPSPSRHSPLGPKTAAYVAVRSFLTMHPEIALKIQMYSVVFSILTYLRTLVMYWVLGTPPSLPILRFVDLCALCQYSQMVKENIAKKPVYRRLQ